MERNVREKLEMRLHRFATDIAFGDLLLKTLENDGFEPTYAREMGAKTWFLWAKPPQHIQEGFGLAPEILLIAIDGEVQARDLQRAASEVVRSGLRLDGNLVVVTDRFPTLSERLERIAGHEQRIAWVWEDDDSWAPLSDVLRRKLPTFDVFDERDPVRGNQLMGRDEEIANLKTRVVRGDAVGVFGLRKMGKTSLVRAVTDWLDPASGIREPGDEKIDAQTLVLWIDAETLDQDADVDDVADEMLAALKRRMRVARASYGSPPKRGLAGLKSACEALLDAGARLCFVIDEYDFLFEREQGRGPVPGLSRLLRLLRAWGQQWQGAVSLVLIGRDPEHLSTPQLDGVTNPLLAWFSALWLGPLAPPGDTEMLRKLGRRVGLDVGHESATLAHRWTGGHPMLHRQFGSALREEVRPKVVGVSWKVATDPHCQQAVERFMIRNAALDVQREILSLLRKRYQGAYNLLVDIARSGNAEAAISRAGGFQAKGSQTLRQFGLLNQAGSALPEHLVWYVRTVLPKQARGASAGRKGRSAGRRTGTAV